MKLLKWTVRHNIRGDEEQSILKTIHNRGIGYDRPSQHDELTSTFKVYQLDEEVKEESDDFKETVYEQEKEYSIIFCGEVLSPLIREILSSMKLHEKTTSVVRAAYV